MGKIARRSTEDLLAYLALGRFRRRPPMSAPPDRTPAGHPDVLRQLYSNGCRRADDLLSRAGDADAVHDACRRSPLGKLLPNALDVHRTALGALDPLLRVYEGCARAYLGEVEGANLIKLHRQSGKVSYLVYPDFDADPHPALLRSIQLNLRTREIESSDYAASANPPVLHRKETFLLPDDPRRPKFDRLTRQEERAGLLDETATIGTRAGWADRLRERGYALRGHRLVRIQTGRGG
jgi:DNA phosphorothioation-associated putative methyltransferase